MKRGNARPSHQDKDKSGEDKELESNERTEGHDPDNQAQGSEESSDGHEMTEVGNEDEKGGSEDSDKGSGIIPRPRKIIVFKVTVSKTFHSTIGNNSPTIRKPPNVPLTKSRRRVHTKLLLPWTRIKKDTVWVLMRDVINEGLVTGIKQR